LHLLGPITLLTLCSAAEHVKLFLSCTSAEHSDRVRIVATDPIREYLSKLGKLGAEAANKNRTPAERKKIARAGAKARWAKKKGPARKSTSR
jgi:hypothetical protein